MQYMDRLIWRVIVYENKFDIMWKQVRYVSLRTLYANIRICTYGNKLDIMWRQARTHVEMSSTTFRDAHGRMEPSSGRMEVSSGRMEVSSIRLETRMDVQKQNHGEQIAKAKVGIKQSENHIKTLLQKKNNLEHNARTLRLIERGAILESLVDVVLNLTNEQIKRYCRLCFERFCP